MLFFGRSLNFFVAVVVALLFVSSLYEYNESSSISPPTIWKEKDTSSYPNSSRQQEFSHAYGDEDIIDEQIPSESSSIAKPPSPFGKLNPFRGKQESKSSVPVDEYMKDILKWDRPKEKDGHWPLYRDFRNRDYDPNRWEGFPE
jgi:hypothetical protein